MYLVNPLKAHFSTSKVKPWDYLVSPEEHRLITLEETLKQELIQAAAKDQAVEKTMEGFN